MTCVVFLANGFEEIEAVTIIDYLRRANVEVTTVAVSNVNLVTGSHKIPVIADVALDAWFSENKIADGGNLPDAIYLPGGMPGATNLADSDKVLETIKKCFSAGKLVTSLCASPAVVLSKTGVLDGKSYTCYPGMEVGGKAVTDVPFVHDGNLLTGRGPGTAEQFSMKLVELLAGKETSDKIKSGSCQR